MLNFVTQESCTGNGCQCDFGDESPFKSKSEILAAAVGALSPLIAVGGGFGIWKLFQSKMTNTNSGLSREGSDISDGSTRKPRSTSPATNSTHASMESRSSRATPLTLNDMDFDSDLDFPQSPTPSESPRWSSARQPPPSLTNRAPVPAKHEDLNSWMF